MSPPCTRTAASVSNRHAHPHRRRSSGPLQHLAAALVLLAGTAHAAAPETLEDRIACQTALDDVRWSHTIWPGVNPGPKPPRADVIPDPSIRAKVLDQLRKEQALFGRYGERIDTAALQAELDRMARETRAPDQLRDLYAALDNDPATIAECLARPALVDRRLRKRYDTDDAMHADVRARAASALATGDAPAHPGAGKAASAHARGTEPEVSTITYVRIDEPDRLAREQRELDTPTNDIALDAAEWNALLTDLDRAAARDARVGTPQAEETDTALVHRIVLERSENHLVLQVTQWNKRFFDGWWRSDAPHWSSLALSKPAASVLALSLTPIAKNDSSNAKIHQPGDAMPDNTWRTEDAPEGRYDHTAIWTGSEMIVWGGYMGRYLSSGGRFDPSTNTWRPTSVLNAPVARSGHSAVWAGTSMLVWGGYSEGFGPLASGASYDPKSDTWTALPPDEGNTPSARSSHSAVWTGTEMIVWGGFTAQGTTNTGGRYNPATIAWTATATGSAPTARYAHTAIWTGDRMIVWGGRDGNLDHVASGGIFNPTTPQGSWQPTPLSNAPSGRFGHTAVWADDPQTMIIWGGIDNVDQTNSGSRLERSGNTWVWNPTSQTASTPSARWTHTAVWANDLMVVVGGRPAPGADGASYDPVLDLWEPIPAVGNADEALAYIEFHTAVWTGNPDAPSASDRMLIWGGTRSSNISDSRTFSYDPTGAGTWTTIGEAHQPAPTTNHSTVWTGTQILLWGGRDGGYGVTNAGARYVAATGDWLPLPTPDNADRREHHTAVWTGTEMIVWGGLNKNGVALQRGARYNPLLGDAGEWVEPSITLGPPRSHHEAVWAGDRMIIWGGHRPDTNTWHSTGLELFPGTGNQPSTGNILQPPDQRTRRHFSLTWAPERGEVLLWGGQNADGSVVHADGWRYNPVTKAAGPIAASNPGRYGHEAVWTGNSLLIAGGLETSKPADTAITYFPAQAAWATTALPTEPRIFHSLVWTGTQALAWGGLDASSLLQSGERITPPATPQQAGSVTPMSLVDAPLPRMQHTAVWSGERMEMLVWGGQGQGGFPLANLGVYSASGVGKPTPIFADGFE